MTRKSGFLVAVVLFFISLAALAAPVNINKADAKTIAKELEGVGEVKAEAIVAYRKQHGPFKKPEDLLQVEGIGKSTLEKNRAAIVLTME